MFEGLQAARTKVEDWMENADVWTMRLVLLPSRSISNYKEFTGSDKLFLIPSAIKADTLEPLRRADLPAASMGKFKSSAFLRGKRIFFPLGSRYRSNFLKLQGFVLSTSFLRLLFQLETTSPLLHAFMLHVWLAMSCLEIGFCAVEKKWKVIYFKQRKEKQTQDPLCFCCCFTRLERASVFFRFGLFWQLGRV